MKRNKIRLVKIVEADRRVVGQTSGGGSMADPSPLREIGQIPRGGKKKGSNVGGVVG